MRAINHRSFFTAIYTLIGGALIPLSFSPINFWFCGIIGTLLFIDGLQNATQKQALLRGWLFGIGLFGVGTSWVYVSIHTYGSAPVSLAIFLTVLFTIGLALFYAMQAYCYVRFFRRTTLGLILGFPALWVLCEWFRSWFLTGFPWLYLGYAHDSTWLAGWAPVLGVYGVSFFVVLTAVLLFLIIRLSKRVRVILSIFVLLPWLSGFLLQQINWTKSKKDPITVSLIQGNIAQEIKWNPAHMIDSVKQYEFLSKNEWSRDLVIWPEAAMPFWYDEVTPVLNQYHDHAKQLHSGFMTGIPYRESTAEGRRYHNSVVGLGTASGLYHKVNLVPFGEYVPLESLLRGLIAFFDLPMSSFSPGKNTSPFLLLNNEKVAPFICYEIVYPDYVARTLPDADILLTVSNDTWFGRSWGPWQHLQIAQMRALETGRYLLRATNNGISAIIDPRGKIVDQAPQFVEAILRGEVFRVRGNTPFGYTGSWPILLISVLILFATRIFNKPR